MKYFRLRFTPLLLACSLILALSARPAQAGPDPVVVMETSMGRIMIMLSTKDAPKTVANFLKYVNAGFYDNTVFHRVVKQGRGEKGMAVVQGGGYTFPINRKRPLFPPIPNEAGTGLMNEKGTIAMARADAPDSATCEFFFNVKDNPVLDFSRSSSQTGAGSYSQQTTAGYCAFGKIIRGMDVVEKISEVQTARAGRMEDVPVNPVFLKKAYVAR
ncbi:Peptidyl-prolyl cis-trans isomerase A precursor [Pseudodesulfovibrio hydrargyri]|uniref:Peptidyl-prolyl cis-trans isomerase n=1 Tax=Pseudodesulfovibrio hydrargyri TaxID=2125990 RepID=A0A1J5MUK8_9BACT|nr:peptidylprolyl isomerase [Pseudodesulfovibrio hydrargyri]OIQ50301.1 Peptidyl-prolyl cis-trans isomerase A precursor [Pseudodesulfovibrio hydrargyri]